MPFSAPAQRFAKGLQHRDLQLSHRVSPKKPVVIARPGEFDFELYRPGRGDRLRVCP